MPTQQLRPWFDVTMWAQVRLPDRGLVPWTVLPFTGMLDTPETVSRDLWRQPFERLSVQAPRFALVTVLEPDEPEAVASLLDVFGPDLTVLETDDGKHVTVHAPILHDVDSIHRHLQDDHSVGTGNRRRLADLGDAQQYHGGLHQQVAMYPPRRAHWHR